MKKNAIPYVTLLFNEQQLKKYAITFKTLYFNTEVLASFKKQVEQEGAIGNESVTYKIDLIEFLVEKGIAEFYTIDNSIYSELAYTEYVAKYNESPIISEHATQEETAIKMERVFDSVTDTMTRMNASRLSLEKGVEIFPLLYNTNGFESSGRKHDVIKFTMNKIPIPHENTPWEQIFDFRTDEDVQTSFLELINWTNTVACSNKSISDIQDEFESLYSVYVQRYKLHKMKSSMTTMEIIVSATLDALTTLQPLGLLKELFNLRKTKISLMEEELKLPGKEIAYIYKANETFDSA